MSSVLSTRRTSSLSPPTIKSRPLSPLPPSDNTGIVLAGDSLLQSTARDYYLANPVEWAQDRLGEFYWSKQKEIFNTVRDNRRTVVYSCHRIGKSMSAARIAFWWLDCHKPGEALVITSAHSATQVKMALWREMGRVHALGRFPGRMNQTEYWMPVGEGREEMVAFGRKPASDDPSAFQGTYAPFILFIMDEGCYVPETLWKGAETLVSNDQAKILALGNPDDPNTEFGRICTPGSKWTRIQIGWEDTPNFTGEWVPPNVANSIIGKTWVEEIRERYGEDNPYYQSKVLGVFPIASPDSMALFPITLVKAAQDRTLQPTGERRLGVDVGGGANKNSIALSDGPVIRVIYKDQNPDTMATKNNTVKCLRETGATVANVDYIGIGHGAVDSALESANDQRVKFDTPELADLFSRFQGVNVALPAEDSEQFVNLRAELYWGLYLAASEGQLDLDPDDEVLAAQLCAIRYKRSAGRIQVESKVEMKARKVPSPDELDSVILSRVRKKEVAVFELTW